MGHYVDISNSRDVIDSRDIIKRIEELTDEREDLESEAKDDTNVEIEVAKEALADWDASEDGEELQALQALESEASESPDWIHGETLIRDSYFQEYAQQIAEDIGEIDSNASWPQDCIDWEKAADQLKQDYFQVDYDGVDYWIRA